MYERHILGKEGESVTEKYLLDKNYEIIERNFYCKQGEIDIIAKDKDELVFIEVKTRTNKNYGEPIDAVTYYKRKHIFRTIEYYLYIKKIENIYVRIDIIEIFKKDNKFYIRHVKNAMIK